MFLFKYFGIICFPTFFADGQNLRGITDKDDGSIEGQFLFGHTDKGAGSIKGGYLNRFQLVPYADSSGYDLYHSNGSLEDIAKECFATSDCKAFNFDGWVKNYVRPMDDWYKYTSDETKGLYLKDFYLTNFIFHATWDAHGNDIRRMDGTEEEVAFACYGDDDCLGFNSNGWMKYKLDNLVQWTHSNYLGFYEKTTDAD